MSYWLISSLIKFCSFCWWMTFRCLHDLRWLNFIYLKEWWDVSQYRHLYCFCLFLLRLKTGRGSDWSDYMKILSILVAIIGNINNDILRIILINDNLNSLYAVSSRPSTSSSSLNRNFYFSSPFLMNIWLYFLIIHQYPLKQMWTRQPRSLSVLASTLVQSRATFKQLKLIFVDIFNNDSSRVNFCC